MKLEIRTGEWIEGNIQVNRTTNINEKGLLEINEYPKELNKLWISKESSHKRLLETRKEVKCLLEDECELDVEIVNKVKEIFSRHLQEIERK